MNRNRWCVNSLCQSIWRSNSSCTYPLVLVGMRVQDFSCVIYCLHGIIYYCVWFNKRYFHCISCIIFIIYPVLMIILPDWWYLLENSFLLGRILTQLNFLFFKILYCTICLQKALNASYHNARTHESELSFKFFINI